MAAAELLRCPYGGAIGREGDHDQHGRPRPRDRPLHGREDRKFRLSISLGAATDAKRAQLVPVAARTPVAEVMAAARRHVERRGGRVMLSYVCIGGRERRRGRRPGHRRA